jgi:hypothetical protein
MADGLCTPAASRSLLRVAIELGVPPLPANDGTDRTTRSRVCGHRNAVRFPVDSSPPVGPWTAARNALGPSLLSECRAPKGATRRCHEGEWNIQSVGGPVGMDVCARATVLCRSRTIGSRRNPSYEVRHNGSSPIQFDFLWTGIRFKADTKPIRTQFGAGSSRYECRFNHKPRS